jgi:hypothetical protein
MRRVTGIGGRRLQARHFLEANMKRILSVALVLGLCGLARARDAGDARGAQADPVGTWKCEYAIGDMKRTATLTIRQDGDKLAGTMSWPDQKEAELKDVKLTGGELSFSAERVLGENKYPVEYRFTIDGNTLKGKGAVENAGRKTEFDIAGKREKKDK